MVLQIFRGYGIELDYEFNNGYREIHMGQTEFPVDVEFSRMGYSIGHIEDHALVIHTKYFSPDRWGNGKGVPSGKNKEVFYATTDPEYLSGPKTPVRGAFVLRNNIELTDWQCDPEAAVRHLTGE